MSRTVEYHATVSHQAPDWTTERLVITATVPAGQEDQADQALRQ